MSAIFVFSTSSVFDKGLHLLKDDPLCVVLCARLRKRYLQMKQVLDGNSDASHALVGTCLERAWQICGWLRPSAGPPWWEILGKQLPWPSPS